MIGLRDLGVIWLLALGSGALPGCGPEPRSAVSLRMQRDAETPSEASVYVDEEYVAPLGVVIARGIRLPEGTHRITIQHRGYFPWDRLVESDREPIRLVVRMKKIPD